MSSPAQGFTPLGHPPACLWDYMANGSFHGDLLSDHKTTIVSLTHPIHTDSPPCHSERSEAISPDPVTTGNCHLAWAFVEAVHHALRVCPKAKSFYEKKRAKRNGALATKALAAKWSQAAYYMMKRQEAFDLKRVFG